MADEEPPVDDLHILFPPYDGSIPHDEWRFKRAKDLRLYQASRSSMLKHRDENGKPIYTLTDGGRFKRARTVSKGLRARVIARDGGQCVACGSSGPFEVDHIIRYVDGGTEAMENLQTLCEPCHRRKGGR
jgi:hypothetical protein